MTFIIIGTHYVDLDEVRMFYYSTDTSRLRLYFRAIEPSMDFSMSPEQYRKFTEYFVKNCNVDDIEKLA